MKHAALLLLVFVFPSFGCEKRASSVSVEEEPKPAAWAPPTTTIPKDFVDETAFLLEHGLGDPRGKGYGSAFVKLGSALGGEDKSVEIHGWPSGGASSRIVSLGGLVYDVVAPGRQGASREGDVQSFQRAASPSTKSWMMPIGGDPATMVRLLLIDGRTGLAERLYSTLGTGLSRRNEPFWVRLFHQAIEAHSVGDDRTALRIGQLIRRERPAYTARLRAQVDPRTHALPRGEIVEGDPYAYLDVVDDLVADSERRLSAAPRPPIDPKTASIAALIDRLDDVSARQWSQPGGVDLVADPIVAALAAKGDAAADPLFEAMDRDKRLTRSVSFGRDFFPQRHLITVREAAFAAFQSFAQTDQFPAGSMTKLDVPALRTYWAANRGKTGPERWFATLADDGAGWQKWEEATRRLFDPEGTQRMGNMSRGPQTGKPYAEPLREKINPSLSDLLDRRARDITKPDEAGGSGPLTSSLQMGLDLAAWEPARSVPLLRDLTHQAIEELRAGRMMDDYAGTFVVPAIEARAQAGDATAWADYPKLLSAIKRFPSLNSKLLRPMAEHPDVPAVRDSIRLLTTRGSIYDVVGRIRQEPGVAGSDSIVVSPLLGLPALFDAVAKALEDRTVIGTSWIDDRGNGWVEAKGKPFPSQGVRPDPRDPMPPAGEKRPLRMADVMAHDLARLTGAPRFQPFWTKTQKDRAIAKIKAFLREHRRDIKAVVPWPNDWKSGFEAMADRRKPR